MNRPENRKYHFTYEVTCINTGRIYYGLCSCDELDDNFKGKGQKLSQSIKEYGKENHSLKILQLFETRDLAVQAYNKLKELELKTPVLVSNHLYHYVYLTVRFDGKYYIGAHSTNKLNDSYKGSGIYITRSLRKYGKDKHTFEILEMCSSREHAFQREDEIITPEILADPLCMNLCKGGQCKTRTIYGFTEESSKLISEKGKVAWAEGRNTGNTGYKASEETIELRRAKLIGQKRSEAHLEILRAAQQKYYQNADREVLIERGQKSAKTRTENGNNNGGRPKGIPMCDETKLAQSLRTKGVPLSDHHKKALSVPKKRASCLFCQKETTGGSILRYHLNCC